MSRESEEIAEYPRSDTPMRDAIGEEDNAIPTWFNVGFYGLIVFGLIYIALHLAGFSQESRYQREILAAEERLAEFAAARPAPTANPYTGDATAIAEGKQTFEQICAACHKADGTGLVGPSLVDPYWKYGDSDADRFVSVAEGRPLGMPPWIAQLGTEKIWKALAYADTLPRQDAPGVGAPDYVAPGSAP